jgi:hypothetical protein
VPAATPVPRSPTLLAPYSAADLLTGQGCPVCRYASESADRHLAWFALEAHADAATVTRLCSSLGMCARHTRGLMCQPGAARRLTAVYRYLMRAARERLSGGVDRLAACPACEHDDRASGMALEVLLEELAEDGPVRDRYLELGGLCIPHLRSAPARGGRQVISWLAQAMTAAFDTSPVGFGWLAGTDRDAAARVALRRAAASARVLPGLTMCAACLAGSQAENDCLARIARHGGHGVPDPRLLLCARHLNDLIVSSDQRDAGSLLKWQAASLVADLTGRPGPQRGRNPRGPAGWLRPRRPAADPGNCAVCQGAADAAQQAVGELRAALRSARPAPGGQIPLCVRHLLDLRVDDPWAGRVAVPAAAERAGALIAELDEAFSKGTWARRHEASGPEMTAWRQAAAFLDGNVFYGCPPSET